MENEKKAGLIKDLLKKNIFIGPDDLEKLNKEENLAKIYLLLEKNNLTEEAIKSIISSKEENNVRVVFSYKDSIKKREAQDFTSYFNYRYNALRSILMNRQELQNATSIKRIISKKEREEISIIGMVHEKRFTKNNNIILTIEDTTGLVNVLVNKNKQEMYALAKDIVLDETIGVVGTLGENIVFSNNILLPDVPNKELKKSPNNGYVVFVGDFHFGSKAFLKEPFEKFLKWIKGELGSEEQRSVASKIKYLFLVGDLVDGVGIYANHFNDLEVQDIKQQYVLLAEALKEIPSRIKIIVAPGNHDAMRIAEPQPSLYRDFAEAIYNMPNVTCVSNPAIINIDSTERFPGFDILIYHGYSFNYYAFEVESIRQSGAQRRADLIMKFLLQRRHLAPTHASTLYIPDPTKDHLVIEQVPDFFVSGHIHRATISNYKNITLLNCSCWIEKTAYQERIGLEPEPARAIIVNLQTREARIMRF